eukprot:Seg1553.3 transcript_id=Seg1553.3/GoldUCD/mRNA.D3Y31 product="hypothetical protein" protein_id=Seg1553.3/GoldUCD/D3Y31
MNANQTISIDHDYHCSDKEPYLACLDKNSVLLSLANKVSSLTIENKQLQERYENVNEELKVLQLKKKSRKPFSAAAIISDSKMRFYTGIQTILIFNALYLLMKPYVCKLQYWRGKNSVLTSKVKKGFLPQKKIQKLNAKDQLLLVLMKLRLCLLNQDLADRFYISEASCSSIFATWIKFLGKFLGDALIVWLRKDAVFSNLPSIFKGAYRNSRCIIDCSEMYIERPKSLNAQASTWSDYKKHNTFKFLISIAPSGYITYISDCYGGRATDQFICQNSGFYNLLEYGDEVMADRGFQIKEDLLHHYCSLSIPPGARGKSQMTAAECKKTKEVANLRIHVERAINRLKTFRILKNIFPMTMLPLADDIIRTCAALCNIQPPLIR